MKRVLIFGLMVLLLGACTVNPTSSTAGSLKINITGLGSGVAGKVRISGPDGFSQEVGASQQLSNLKAGSYTIVADTIDGALVGAQGKIYNPSIKGSPVTVQQGKTAEVTVSYDALANLTELEPNDLQSQAQPVDYDVVITGKIATNSDVDWYKFTAKAGDWVKLDIDAKTLTPPSSLDSAIALYSESGVQILSNDDTAVWGKYNNDSVLVYKIPVDGNYAVKVSSFLGQNNGSYELKILNAAPVWSLRAVGGNRRQVSPNGQRSVNAIFWHEIVDTTLGGYGPTGKFTFTIIGPAGWNGGNPYSREVILDGTNSLGFSIPSAPGVTPTSKNAGQDVQAFSDMKPFVAGSYTLSFDLFGQQVSTIFSMDADSAIGVPEPLELMSVSTTSVGLNWPDVPGAARYCALMYDAANLFQGGGCSNSSAITIAGLSLSSDKVYNVSVFAYDWSSFEAAYAQGKANSSVNSSLRFTLGGTSLPGNVMLQNWPSNKLGTLTFKNALTTGGASTTLGLVGISSSGTFNYAFPIPPSNTLIPLTGISCSGTGSISYTPGVSAVDADLMSVSGQVQGKVGIASRSQLLGSSEQIQAALPFKTEALAQPQAVGDSQAILVYANKNGSFTGTCAISGLEYVYDIHFVEGWNYLIATQAAQNRIEFSAATALPSNLKWWFISTAPISATVSGQVFTPATPAALNIPSEAKFVPGEALVKFKQGIQNQVSRLGTSVYQVRDIGSDIHLVRRSQPTVSLMSVAASSSQAQETLDWIASLRMRDDVEFAEPNYWRYASVAAPDDPSYASDIKPRFDLINVNVGGAWDLTTGSSGVVVGVIDTGILWHGDTAADTHPDFKCGRVLPGYDFVSYTSNGDGGGRDGDPYSAPGDFHGSHVAGTIGACTNNGIGVAGVDWAAKILPVRVLGLEGGTVADILDGVRWAAGLAVTGAPINPNPAKVLNLSLGGLGFSEAEEEVYRQVAAAGVITVVAAGNDNDEALRYSPAGDEAVITVGAVDALGAKASFSNYGPGVEVMAPGVNILSTSEGATPGTFGYQKLSGTSMATPHIAGVVALMAAVKPNLTWVEAIDYLQKGATAIPGCTGCGAGIVNAADAIARAQRGDPVGAFLTPSKRFNFGLTQITASVTLSNYGGADASLSAPTTGRLSLTPSTANIPAGSSQNFTLNLSRPTENGSYYSILPVDGGNAHASALFAQYFAGTGVSNLGSIKIALCQEISSSASNFIRGTTINYNNIYSYSLDITGLSGTLYYLRAWVDANNDNITEYVTGRNYLNLSGASKVQHLGLIKAAVTLTMQGCVVQ